MSLSYSKIPSQELPPHTFYFGWGQASYPDFPLISKWFPNSLLGLHSVTLRVIIGIYGHIINNHLALLNAFILDYLAMHPACEQVQLIVDFSSPLRHQIPEIFASLPRNIACAELRLADYDLADQPEIQYFEERRNGEISYQSYFTLPADWITLDLERDLEAFGLPKKLRILPPVNGPVFWENYDNISSSVLKMIYKSTELQSLSLPLEFKSSLKAICASCHQLNLSDFELTVPDPSRPLDLSQKLHLDFAFGLSFLPQLCNLTIPSALITCESLWAIKQLRQLEKISIKKTPGLSTTMQVLLAGQESRRCAFQSLRTMVLEVCLFEAYVENAASLTSVFPNIHLEYLNASFS